jgi:hypothetical protein
MTARPGFLHPHQEDEDAPAAAPGVAAGAAPGGGCDLDQCKNPGRLILINLNPERQSHSQLCFGGLTISVEDLIQEANRLPIESSGSNGFAKAAEALSHIAECCIASTVALGRFRGTSAPVTHGP